MVHVAIIHHPQDDLLGGNYFIRHIAEAWRARQIKVSLVSDPEAKADADIALLHVDLSLVPPEYARLAARFPRCINARLLDIRKRAISRQLVTYADGYDGPVIVKTDLNYGGVRERLLYGRPSHFRRGLRWLRGGRWAACDRIRSDNYPVFARASDVPDAVWTNPALVVERYLAEREGDITFLRTWVFLGDRYTHFRWWSRDPVIKIAKSFIREPVGEVPEQLWDRRRELGIDFAKIDYGMVDGRPVLYDVSRTPSVGFAPASDLAPRIAHLEQGLGSFVRSSTGAD